MQQLFRESFRFCFLFALSFITLATLNGCQVVETACWDCATCKANGWPNASFYERPGCSCDEVCGAHGDLSLPGPDLNTPAPDLGYPVMDLLPLPPDMTMTYQCLAESSLANFMATGGTPIVDPKIYAAFAKLQAQTDWPNAPPGIKVEPGFPNASPGPKNPLPMSVWGVVDVFSAWPAAYNQQPKALPSVGLYINKDCMGVVGKYCYLAAVQFTFAYMFAVDGKDFDKNLIFGHSPWEILQPNSFDAGKGWYEVGWETTDPPDPNNAAKGLVDLTTAFVENPPQNVVRPGGYKSRWYMINAEAQGTVHTNKGDVPGRLYICGTARGDQEVVTLPPIL